VEGVKAAGECGTSGVWHGVQLLSASRRAGEPGLQLRVQLRCMPPARLGWSQALVPGITCCAQQLHCLARQGLGAAATAD
jgi:hypothetical protein